VQRQSVLVRHTRFNFPARQRFHIPSTHASIVLLNSRLNARSTTAPAAISVFTSTGFWLVAACRKQEVHET
jgi:hypothetical protein